MDAFCTFDDKTTLAGGTFNVGTTLNAHSFDTRAAGSPAAIGPSGAIGGPLLHDIGRGVQLKLLTQITTTAVGATATMDAQFVCADDEALTANLTVLMTTTAIGVASLVAGYRFKWGHIPRRVPRRFIGTQYVVGTANFTAGAIWSGLVLDVGDHADIFG